MPVVCVSEEDVTGWRLVGTTGIEKAPVTALSATAAVSAGGVVDWTSSDVMGGTRTLLG